MSTNTSNTSLGTKGIFEKILEDMKENFQNQRKEYYDNLKEEAKTYEGLGHGEMNNSFKEKYGKYCYSNPNSRAREISKMMAGKNNECSYIWSTEMAVRSDIDTYIQKRIDKDTADMFEAFVQKQTAKIDGILKGRNAEITGSVDNKTLECYLHFRLSDGASFDMKCQIIWKLSVKGKLFWQFPTTFHNAMDSKREKIKSPSQSKLKKLL